MQDKNLMKNRFIEKAISKFGDKFKYDKVDYINSSTKIIITCPIHGDFETTPSQFLQSKHGCKKCAIKEGHQKQTRTTKEFIQEAIKIYKDRFLYDKTKYINSNEKVIITCKKHGDFLSRPSDFLRGHSCPKCKGESQKLRNKQLFGFNTEEFINRAKLIHGDKYDYSEVDYINDDIKIAIICPKHGIFYQTPQLHLRGQGCPICKSSKGENLVSRILDKLKFQYITQYKINYNNKNYYADFYLPDLNTIIEFNGQQHYNLVEAFGGIKKLELQVQRDAMLRDYCFINNITILEIPYTLSEEEILKRISKLNETDQNRVRYRPSNM